MSREEIEQVEKELTLGGRHTYLYAPKDDEPVGLVVRHLNRAGIIVLLVLNKDLKNKEEIKQLLLQMNYENYSIFIQLELENYNYGYLFIDHKEYELYYYNDFDDYEDEIEFASKNWIKMIKNK